MDCLPFERRVLGLLSTGGFLGFQRGKRELQISLRAAQVLDLAWLGLVAVC